MSAIEWVETSNDQTGDICFEAEGTHPQLKWAASIHLGPTAPRHFNYVVLVWKDGGDEAVQLGGAMKSFDDENAIKLAKTACAVTVLGLTMPCFFAENDNFDGRVQLAQRDLDGFLSTLPTEMAP